MKKTPPPLKHAGNVVTIAGLEMREMREQHGSSGTLSAREIGFLGSVLIHFVLVLVLASRPDPNTAKVLEETIHVKLDRAARQNTADFTHSGEPENPAPKAKRLPQTPISSETETAENLSEQTLPEAQKKAQKKTQASKTSTPNPKVKNEGINTPKTKPQATTRSSEIGSAETSRPSSPASLAKKQLPLHPAETTNSEQHWTPDYQVGSARQPSPELPNSALAAGQRAEVILGVHVNPDGSIYYLEILKSSGLGALDYAAWSTVKNTWSFDARPLPGPERGFTEVAIAFEKN